MNILKELLLIFLIWCSVFVSEILSESGHLLRAGLPHKYVNRRANINEQSNCFCFMKDPNVASIPDQLNGGNGVKRLVIYFYVDPLTGFITKYVPNAEKQARIPDLDLSPGDDLSNINKDEFSNIVTTHPNIILIRRGNNILQGAINNGQNFMVKPTPENSEHNSGPTKPYTKELNARLNAMNMVLTPQNTNKSPLSFSNLNTGNPKTDILLNHPAMMQTSQASLTPNQWPKNSQVSVTPIAQWPNSLLNKNLNEAVNSDGVISFNNWFQKQMKDVQMVSPMKPNDLDIASLKKLIENTLTEYGIVVSNGILKDASGNVLETENLHLRPILIGDSVGYNRLLKITDKYSLPPNLPYLKALLVTMVHPSKILGIVPLGKIHLSREAMLSADGLLDIQDKLAHQTQHVYTTPHDQQNLKMSASSQCQTAQCLLQNHNSENMNVQSLIRLASNNIQSNNNDNHLKHLEEFLNNHGQSQSNQFNKQENTYFHQFSNEPGKISNEDVRLIHSPASVINNGDSATKYQIITPVNNEPNLYVQNLNGNQQKNVINDERLINSPPSVFNKNDYTTNYVQNNPVVNDPNSLYVNSINGNQQNYVTKDVNLINSSPSINSKDDSVTKHEIVNPVINDPNLINVNYLNGNIQKDHMLINSPHSMNSKDDSATNYEKNTPAKNSNHPNVQNFNDNLQNNVMNDARLINSLAPTISNAEYSTKSDKNIPVTVDTNVVNDKNINGNLQKDVINDVRQVSPPAPIISNNDPATKNDIISPVKNYPNIVSSINDNHSNANSQNGVVNDARIINSQVPKTGNDETSTKSDKSTPVTVDPYVKNLNGNLQNNVINDVTQITSPAPTLINNEPAKKAILTPVTNDVSPLTPSNVNNLNTNQQKDVVIDVKPNSSPAPIISNFDSNTKNDIMTPVVDNPKLSDSNNLNHNLEKDANQLQVQDVKGLTENLQNGNPSNTIEVTPIKGTRRYQDIAYGLNQLNPLNAIESTHGYQDILYNAINPLRVIEASRRKHDKKFQYTKGEPQYADAYELDSEELDDLYKDISGEEPGFRIIGGSPATSSGTPISVRGRSGWIGLR